MIVSKRAEILRELAAKIQEVAGLMERLAAVEEEGMIISTGVNEKSFDGTEQPLHKVVRFDK